MKIDTISIHERDTIIHHLNQSGKWKDQRQGATVEMARLETKTGSEIYFTVTMRPLVVNGREKSVAEAVTTVNRIIQGRLSRADPMAGRAVRDSSRPGMPTLVRQRNSKTLEEAKLFEDK